MKKIFFTLLSMFILSTSSIAKNPITLKQVTDGSLVAKMIFGINPLKGTSEYASISDDKQRIEKFSFNTGKKTGVLFDLSTIKNKDIEKFDDYLISDNGAYILIQTQTERIYRHSFKAQFYIYNVNSKSLKPLSVNGPQQIPTFSPDGNFIAFVRDNNIFITNGDTEKQVTNDGAFNKIINGLPDWVNEEEFGFSNAMAWSADSKSLSWIKYDESHVKTYAMQLFKGDAPAFSDYELYPGEYAYKYPKAGEDNAKVSVWSYNLEQSTTKKIAVPLDADGYIPRILPTSINNKVVVFTMNRHQDTLNLYAINPSNGECKIILTESVPKYIKEDAMSSIRIVKDKILLPSDRDGYMHLYLYDINGQFIRQIEKGAYDVITVYGYDEKTGSTYYQAAMKTPMQREIYVADKNGKVKELTHQDGWNNAVFSGDYKYFLNNWSDRNTPYRYVIYNNEGKQIREVLNNSALEKELVSYNLAQREFFKFTTSEGIELNGWMVKPDNFDANKKYPVIMFQYSGPGSQQVTDRWSVGSMGNGGLFDTYLVQHGYIVVCVDGRGTGARGAEFEKCTYLKLGQLESKDQVEAARWLGKQTYVDASRIGIWGWSFGGFNTLMSMSDGSGIFKAGVSVAPPTNWRFYDSVYTERYMRTPKENQEGYGVNPISRANNLQGKLLICHGLADDNVHIQNVFEYSEALVQADKDFKEMLYTNRNHGIFGGNTRHHLLNQIAEWFFKNL